MMFLRVRTVTFDEDNDASEVTEHTESGDNDSTNGGKTGSNSDHKFWHKKDLKGLRKNARYYTKEEDSILTEDPKECTHLVMAKLGRTNNML